ncbi:hypothetical protein D018_1787B, partial [Vibrio parahaemolyticus VP2007-007]
GYS